MASKFVELTVGIAYPSEFYREKACCLRKAAKYHALQKIHASLPAKTAQPGGQLRLRLFQVKVPLQPSNGVFLSVQAEVINHRQKNERKYVLPHGLLSNTITTRGRAKGLDTSLIDGVREATRVENSCQEVNEQWIQEYVLPYSDMVSNASSGQSLGKLCLMGHGRQQETILGPLHSSSFVPFHSKDLGSSQLPVGHYLELSLPSSANSRDVHHREFISLLPRKIIGLSRWTTSLKPLRGQVSGLPLKAAARSS
ncbi:uncharacterized protein CLUP02_03163 [Colletotrichum lupini]|uniref:Uncharacterized protein n=1 Tax=Colletotrichum lupini TaxID=145971 RepID=A0A9Q8WCG5_9PEZI|nr:uncharacterized protein CLUP02_03163 [Colletotrichum lupini]UQC77692.1 hypothetical protein CLUP02_03163 [Colletotrichum lupini]